MPIWRLFYDSIMAFLELMAIHCSKQRMEAFEQFKSKKDNLSVIYLRYGCVSPL